MPTNWNDITVLQRLICAMYLEREGSSTKLNFNEIARLFGQNTTYDSIQGYFRKIRKDAEKLKAEAGGDPQTPSRKPATPKTPRVSTPRNLNSSLHGVTTGRITKPSPKKRNGKVKSESPKTTPEPVFSEAEDNFKLNLSDDSSDHEWNPFSHASLV